MPVVKKISEHALILHRKAIVIDMHSDAHLDVVRARGRGETHVLERRHLPNWKAGGVNMVVLNTIPRFGPTPYPYTTSLRRKIRRRRQFPELVQDHPTQDKCKKGMLT